MRIRLDISYDGHNFMGFQRQTDLRSVQKEIEIVLSKIFNTPIVITASGRTDAKVHALNQVVTFTPTREINDLEKLRYSLNCILPNDIHVNKIAFVDDTFHPRASAISKEYHYLLNMGEANPFYENYRWEFKRKLDVPLMKQAMKCFIGEHNFMNFTTKEEDAHNYIRNIYSFDLIENGNELAFIIKGNGFMRYMVRMIIGTIVMVGLHKENISFISEKLNSKNRNTVIYKALPNGLYLYKVFYKEDEQ